MPASQRVQWVLAGINLVALALLGGIVLSGARAPAVSRFTEIDVERLNVVGADGRPLLVLANRQRMPGPRIAGKEYPREYSEGRSLLSGMIFLNEEGDEVGGLLYNGFRKGDGADEYGAIEHLSFDQWKQNQVLALQYNDHGKSRRAGLTVWDRPTGYPLAEEFERAEKMERAKGAELERLREEARAARASGSAGAQRLFVGSRDRVAQVELNDSKGRVRARLLVGEDDVARLEFLSETGAVVARYPN